MSQVGASPAAISATEILGSNPILPQTQKPEINPFAQALEGLKQGSGLSQSLAESFTGNNFGPETITTQTPEQQYAAETVSALDNSPQIDVFSAQAEKDRAEYAQTLVLVNEVDRYKAAAQAEVAQIVQESPAAAAEIQKTLNTNIVSPGRYFKVFFADLLQYAKELSKKLESLVNTSPTDSSTWSDRYQNRVGRSRSGRTGVAQTSLRRLEHKVATTGA